MQILPGWEMSGNTRERLEVSEHRGFEESDGVTLVLSSPKDRRSVFRLSRQTFWTRFAQNALDAISSLS